MACLLYRETIPENPLRVCGPENRMGYAPCSAHVKVFCLSVSAYRECPIYKLKTSNWKKIHWWYRFLNRFQYLFPR